MLLYYMLESKSFRYYISVYFNTLLFFNVFVLWIADSPFQLQHNPDINALNWNAELEQLGYLYKLLCMYLQGELATGIKRNDK